MSVERRCLVCAAPFKIKPSVLKRGNGKYCSHRCARNSPAHKAAMLQLRKRIEKACVVCGATTTAVPSTVAIQGIYCSKKCMALDYKERFRGSQNPSFKHGQYHTKAYKAQYSIRRRIRVRNAKGKHTWRDIAALYTKQRGKCVVCRKELDDKYHVDHLMPLARGGSNWPENLQLLCPKCNAKKGAKHPLEFLVSQGILTP